jgi:hypothetical protein
MKQPDCKPHDDAIRSLPSTRKRSHRGSFGAPSVAEFHAAIAKAAALKGEDDRDGDETSDAQSKS